MATLTMQPGTPRAAPPAAESRPRWGRPGLLVLLIGTAVLYLWNLAASGWANDFYAAAVQAGTMSWKAFFFGSFDPSNFITVDKPPASLWVMELSGRIFGFNQWSMLAPQALEGVAAVALLYAAVRRWSGTGAGLLAGTIFALTPVAALMFRFNNPDALLTLLLVASAYCTVRAVEKADTRWLLLAGTCLGFGFLTKMLQAFLILPALALVYLVAAPTGLRRRLLQLIAAGGAIIASAGWWVAIVELWPASSRPYIGGSTNNSTLQLAFGYNGLGRIFGESRGGGSAGGGFPGGAAPAGGGFPGGGGGGGGFGGPAGITRMFGADFGTQISWLLPAALIAVVIGCWLAGRAARTDRLRTAMLLWGGWLLVNGLVFSFMQGIIHEYYTVALAPPIAALVAVVGRELWQRRTTWFARGAMSVLVAVTGGWSYVLLNRAPTWHPELRYIVAIAAVLAVVALLMGVPSLRRVGVVVAAVATVAGLGASAAYAVQTAGTAHTGATPTAGPGGTGDRPGGFGGPRAFGGNGAPGAPQTGAGFPGGFGGPGGGGRDENQTANSELVALLKATDNTWAAATSGTNGATSLQLSSGKAIMAMGGFSGSDPAPSLADFQTYVAAGRIHYLISGGGRGDGSSGITIWVQAHYTASTVGGQTVYDLTKPAS